MLCEGVELALPAASSWNANEKGVISCTRSVCTDLCGALGPKLVCSGRLASVLQPLGCKANEAMTNLEGALQMPASLRGLHPFGCLPLPLKK